MRKLLLTLCMLATFGLTTSSVKAFFSVSYPYGEFSEVYSLGGGNLGFVYYCWSSGCYSWDVFTVQSSGTATPILFPLAPGAPAARAYYLYQYAYDNYGLYYEAYFTTNGYDWYYVSPHYIPY